MTSRTNSDYGDFKKEIRNWYRKEGRHTLPWRSPALKTKKDGSVDPYRVLVSEIMLQQTQVDRVIPFYKNFLTHFPTVKALAKAPLKEVLKNWQGLGYNRRAKLLHECAKVVVEKYGGRIPRTQEALRGLPGIGPYIAGAIRAFAFNEADAFIETNIRTVYTHHFLNDKPQVSDGEVMPLIEATLDRKNPREWYSALMDYGSFLKRSGIKINAKNTAYKKQSKFEGSDRQIRGRILVLLAAKEYSTVQLKKALGIPPERLSPLLARLSRDGLVTMENRKWSLG